MFKFGFIGMGNMGYAILKGMNEKNSEDITFFEISSSRTSEIKKEFGINYSSSISDLAKNSKYIFLSVKPQVYEKVLTEIKDVVSKDSIIISIAPGFTIEKIKNYLNDDLKIIRTMPNTPALVSEGMSVISFSNDVFSEIEKSEIINVFKSFGEVEVVEETLMDAIVPISGSSPAYVYLFIEAMSDAGVSMGIPRKLSYKLASQSVLGASKMVLESNKHPGELKDNVCSPGGTTIEAVLSLEKSGFRSSVMEAMKEAYKKGKKLG